MNRIRINQRKRKKNKVSINIIFLLIFITSLLGCGQKNERRVQGVYFYKKNNVDSFSNISFRIYKENWYIKFNEEDSKIILNKYKSIDSLEIKTSDTTYSVECAPLLGGVLHKSLFVTPVDNDSNKILHKKIDNKKRVLIGIRASPTLSYKKREEQIKSLVSTEEYEEIKHLDWQD